MDMMFARREGPAEAVKSVPKSLETSDEKRKRHAAFEESSMGESSSPYIENKTRLFDERP